MRERFLRGAGTAALSGFLFLIVYNACNYLTHLRPDVGVCAFSWERYWPVIPWLIVPYWSIDPLFVLAPFLCSGREEASTLRRRLVFSILVAGLFFLLIPLKFAFPRPHVEGIFAPWFKALYTFDQPHNLFPSLHITFRTILAEFYARKTRGIWRAITHGWFSLIGISTLLTWQHHFMDVVGGFWLAAMVMHLFPFDDRRDLAPARNGTVAMLYALAAVACSQIARLSWPWTFIFTWPAFSFVMASFGYMGHGARIYRKAQGRLSFLTKMLMAPLLFAQWLSWRHYRNKSARWDAVTPRVWIGSLPDPADAQEAVSAGVTTVIDLTVEFSAEPAFLALNYHHVPVLDLTAPTSGQLRAAAQIIEEESKSGIVFVHCKAGYSRSAGVVGAWMLTTGRAATIEDAEKLLRAARPGIVIRPEIRRAWEELTQLAS